MPTQPRLLRCRVEISSVARLGERSVLWHAVTESPNQARRRRRGPGAQDILPRRATRACNRQAAQANARIGMVGPQLRQRRAEIGGAGVAVARRPSSRRITASPVRGGSQPQDRKAGRFLPASAPWHEMVLPGTTAARRQNISVIPARRGRQMSARSSTSRRRVARARSGAACRKEECRAGWRVRRNRSVRAMPKSMSSIAASLGMSFPA